MKKVNKKTLQDFGHKLRLLRVGERLSQDALSDLTGIERGYISNIENGKQNPSVGILLNITRALGYEIEFKKK